MVGSTFAFFTATVNGEGGTKEVVNASTVSEVSATYTEGSQIGLTGAAITPGWIGTKEITIKNTSADGVDIDFTIDFGEYENSFKNLQYKLEEGDGTATDIQGTTTSKDDNFVTMGDTNLHDTSKNLVSGHLAKGATQTFTLTFRLKDTGVDQTKDDGTGSFSGKLNAKANASKKVED